MTRVRRYLVAVYDVTDLAEPEIDALGGEAQAQADRSDGHPSVSVVIGETLSDATPRFVGYFRSAEVEGTIISAAAAPSEPPLAADLDELAERRRRTPDPGA